MQPPDQSSTPGAGKPACVTALETAYGPPSQAGFGSAVFFQRLEPGASLEEAARERYQEFVGNLWERYGEEAWMGPWKEVHRREAGDEADIAAELRAIADPDAIPSAPMILDAIDEADQARAALAAAYDDPAVSEVRVFNLGDGGAMSGLLIAGRRAAGEAVFLVFLMD